MSHLLRSKCNVHWWYKDLYRPLKDKLMLRRFFHQQGSNQDKTQSIGFSAEENIIMTFIGEVRCEKRTIRPIKAN